MMIAALPFSYLAYSFTFAYFFFLLSSLSWFLSAVVSGSSGGILRFSFCLGLVVSCSFGVGINPWSLRAVYGWADGIGVRGVGFIVLPWREPSVSPVYYYVDINIKRVTYCRSG